MKYIFKTSILSLIFLCMGFTSVLASTGFVESPIWLYPESPKEGETVTLSTVFRNGEKYTLSGKVLFYDGDILLDDTVIRISPGGVSTASISFRIGAGTHDFRASIASLTEVTSSGKTVPLALPLEAAEMRKVTVTKEVPFVKNTAQVNTAKNTQEQSTTGASPILEQVSALEEGIVSVIPQPVRQAVVDTASTVDTWRENTASDLSASRDEAKAESKAHTEKVASVKAKNGTLSPSDKYVDGPWATIKTLGLSFALFIFSFPVIFYVVGSLLAFFLLRFIYRRIRRGVSSAKDSYHQAHIPKAPSI